MKTAKTVALLILFALFFTSVNSQRLQTDFNSEECRKYRQLIESRPREVLFGIHFVEGSVYFSMSSEKWFSTIFSQPGDGIAVDIIDKEQLECDKSQLNTTTWNKGTALAPVYLPELKLRMKKDPDGGVTIRLGDLPAAVAKKEIEGNLAIVRGNKVCYYINFTNLERTLWDLLDMGLYTDSLIQENKQQLTDSFGRRLFYTRKVEVTVPFQKGKATYSKTDIRPLYDSLSLAGHKVKKIEIRAFSSVEGPHDLNLQLQEKRATTLLAAIQSFQKDEIITEVSTGENWVEFMKAIDNGPFAYMKRMSKDEIKNILKNPSTADSVESILAKHRKGVITLYLDKKTPADAIASSDLATEFSKAIKEKNINRAAAIQQSIFERIGDNKLPSNYLDDIAIPAEKGFSRLLNDKQVYKYLLEQITEDEAVEELKKVEAIDPGNGKIKYNIIALQLRLLQYNEDAADKDELFKRIQKLTALGIPYSLVKRMHINLNILRSEIYMKNGDYSSKNQMLIEIADKYIDKDLSDKDLLSVGKYFSAYAGYELADRMISPRIDQINVDEDLLFFYINLSFFTRANFQSDYYYNMLLNAMSINRERFCRFFNSNKNGGISMQLLMEVFWRRLYCENCSKSERKM